MKGKSVSGTLEPGSKLNDRYTIISLLGAGGMGTVYRATDSVRGCDVAIKLPFAEHDEKDRSPFLIREFETLSKLDSPAIPKAFDRHELSEGATFFSMQLVEGQPLSKLITAGELPPIEQRIAWLCEIAEALRHIHSRGFLYCDLKPENIIVTSLADGRTETHLIDFGITLAAGTQAVAEELNARGTTEYMSPEQHKRRPLDQRSDIYSFGVFGFELLTGHRPFQTKQNMAEVAKAAKLTAMHIKGKIPSARAVNPETPKDLDTLLQVCLQKEKEDRFESAEELLPCLRSVNGAGVVSHALQPILTAIRGMFSAGGKAP